MKYVLWGIGIVVFVLVCAAIGTFMAWYALDIKTGTTKTDDSVQAIKGRMESSAQKVENINKQVINDVQSIRTNVRKKVTAMDDDSVVDGLNGLTGRWRMEKSTSGIRDNGDVGGRNSPGRPRPIGGNGNLVPGRTTIQSGVQ